MGGKKRPTSSRALSGKKSRRPAVAAAVGKATKKRRLEADKPRRTGIRGPGLDVVDDFAALRAMHSNGGNASALRQMEVFEWVGDAVIGELVARCLLSQFHHSPLSARVFRNLRLGVVTNQNLASVFDLIGYQRHTIETRKRKTKEKADVVEAIAGEIVVRLELQRRDARVCARLRSHLDDVVAAMLHEHFKERRRVHQKAFLSGPLTVSFNAFACLPQEHLDDETGELVIDEGAIGAIDKQIRQDSKGEELQQKSIADLIDECEHDDKPRAGETEVPFHSLVDVAQLSQPRSPEWSVFSSSLDEEMTRQVSEASRRASTSIRLLHADHILRSSREIFDVFKIYGMAVLAERVSLALAFPHVALRHTQEAGRGVISVSPSYLTTQRQSVLCMINMERCAILLGICSNDMNTPDEFATRRLRANTLRACVGYYSAIAAEDGRKSIADDVASLLLLLAFSADEATLLSTKASPPRREPLSTLMGAVREATDFMASQVCADLHEAGERPQQPSTPKLLLRNCDSEGVEDLFETLARRSSDLERLSKKTDDASSSQRRKRKRSESDPDGTSHHGKPSPNLVRFVHRRFLFCLEELVVLFAQRKTDECRTKMSSFEGDLEPCTGDAFRKWEVSTSTLTIAMPESFHRLLLHDLCHFHALVSTSKTTRDGTRVTQLRLPMHYTWSKIQRRVTVEEEAIG